MNRLQIAWKALTTGRIDTPAAPLSPAPFTIINGQIVSSPDNKASYAQNGYTKNDIVFAVVSTIADKIRMAPWAAYKVVDENALKAYKAIQSKRNWNASDRHAAAGYKKKALEIYDGDTRLNDLIARPNESQSFNDLVADSSIMKMLTGDRFIYADKLNAGANTGKPFELTIVPAGIVSIFVDRSRWPFRVAGYAMSVYGIKDIPKADILHDKYYNPCETNNEQAYFGLSPLQAGKLRMDRSNAELLAGTMAYFNGGPKTIIFVDDPRFDASQSMSQVTSIKDILTGKQYAGPENTNKIAASGYKMGVIPVGATPTDLNLNESEWSTLRMICNIYGAPSQIFNDPAAKTFNTIVEAEKALTTRCAMPLLHSFRDRFNGKLQTDWGYRGKNIYVDYDMNVFTELQENLAEKWPWVKDLPTTNRRKLELMGEDAPEGFDEWMGKILVPSGYTTSEDYEQNQVDRDLAAGDGGISQNGQGADMQDDSETDEQA